MHENRETSGTSRSNQDRDRAEKAVGRTADRHVPEESDRAVVPVNLPNKEEQSSAEAEEERARAKENIAQSNTHPTQSGKGVSQKLGGVLPGLFVRVPARAQPASGAGCAKCGAPPEASELGARRGHSGVLRPYEPRMDAAVHPAPRDRSPYSSSDPQMVAGGSIGGRQ